MPSKTEQKRLFSQIIEQIKMQMVCGNWKAGSRLPPERVLAEQMGVSRPAIREALRALELIGLVRCVQGDANYLTDDVRECMGQPLSMLFALSGRDVEQVHQLRWGLEVETARLAARLRTEEEAENLLQILRCLEEYQDQHIRGEMDRKLHFAIASCSHNPLILSVLNAASGQIDKNILDIRLSILNEPGVDDAIDLQHRALVEAIVRQDEEQAAQIMEAHMKKIEQSMKQQRK